jgi:hypothetical protein
VYDFVVTDVLNQLGVGMALQDVYDRYGGMDFSK